MATNFVPTFKKLENLEISKQQKLLAIAQQAEEEKKALITIRKEQIFKIFADNSSFTMDDKLLVGFLRFANIKENKEHPTLKEFKALAMQVIPKGKPRKQNTKSA